MVKQRLDPQEVTELADRTLGTRLDLSQTPQSGFASGAIVPIQLAPGAILLHGTLRGLRTVEATGESYPGLNIEIRLEGRSRSQNVHTPTSSFSLDSGLVMIRGARKREHWQVSIPAQSHFDTVSLLISPEALQALAPVSADMVRQCEAWVANEASHIQAASPLLLCLAERALAMHPYDPNASVKGYALALEIMAESLSLIAPLARHGRGNATDIGLVEQARAFIASHPTVSITPARLAEQCLVSTSRLKLAFRRAHSHSISTAIRNEALLQGKRLLLDGVPVSRVALQVGYRTPEGFTKAFHTAYGLSPRDYLKRQCNRIDRFNTR